VPQTASNAGRLWLVTAALLGGLAVAAGALGAHALKASYARDGQLSLADEQALANWETAARYQMYQALALGLVGLLAAQWPGRLWAWAGGALTLGTVLFSGFLYALVLTGNRGLASVVPIGGVLMLVGWGLLAAAVCCTTPQANRSREPS
jgi:uncharacterized membrane protein YgdD (TMEM256/DUF423 family)